MIENELTDILEMLAPGKPLRHGIDRIMEANLGALIFLAESPEKFLEDGLIQLGFRIDADFQPEKLYELAKMDGAIVLNRDSTKILFANAQINPDRSIPSTETGMRHRTAEKLSMQTGNTAIAVSKRRNVVSVFHKWTKTELLPESVLFARLNQEITIAQRYKQTFHELIDYLNSEESKETTTLNDVTEILSKGLLTIKITERTQRYLRELGEAAGSAKLEHDEILRSVPKLVGSIIMDYHLEDLEYQKSEDAIKLFKEIKIEDLVNQFAIAKALGFTVSSEDELEENAIIPRGYRLLYSTKLPNQAVKNVIETFKDLNTLMSASYEDLTNVNGIGKRRALTIINALNRKKKETEVELINENNIKK